MEFSLNSTFLNFEQKGDGPDVCDQADQSGMCIAVTSKKSNRPSENRVRLSQMMKSADS